MPLLDVTYPAGTFTDESRAGLVVPEGSWGAGGEVVRFEQLRQIAQRERETVGAA